MEGTYYASQHELWLKLRLIAVETEQVVQIQCRLRLLHDRPIWTTRG